jgi:hypothetical protein
VYDFTAGDAGLDIDVLRERLRRMDTKRLSALRISAHFCARPYPIEPDRQPPETFVIQLREARKSGRVSVRRSQQCRLGLPLSRRAARPCPDRQRTHDRNEWMKQTTNVPRFEVH